jgi:hypothetical protein
MGRHPLLRLALWAILWLLWLRGGWLSADFVLREIAQRGRHGGSAAPNVGVGVGNAALLSSRQPLFSKE